MQERSMYLDRGEISPCLNCTERYVGCHSICTLYAEFVINNNKIKSKTKKTNYVIRKYSNII